MSRGGDDLAPLARERGQRRGDGLLAPVAANDAERQLVRRAVEGRLAAQRVGVVGPAPPVRAQPAVGVQPLEHGCVQYAAFSSSLRHAYDASSGSSGEIVGLGGSSGSATRS